MKTTVELPDDLFRQAKATAALRGRKFKDLVEEGLRHVIDYSDTDRLASGERPTMHELMKQYCGMVDSGIPDLATNPVHMEAFGHESGLCTRGSVPTSSERSSARILG